MNGEVSAILSLEDPTGSTHGYRAKNNVRVSPSLEIYHSRVLIPVRSYHMTPVISVIGFPVALDQYHASLTSGDPWRMADDQGNESTQEQDLRPTNSARRIEALIEQVTGQKLSFRVLPCPRILTSGGM